MTDSPTLVNTVVALTCGSDQQMAAGQAPPTDTRHIDYWWIDLIVYEDVSHFRYSDSNLLHLCRQDWGLQHYIHHELISDQILDIRVAAGQSYPLSHLSKSKDVMFRYYFSEVKAGHINRTWGSSHNQLFYKPSNHQNSVQLRPGDNICPQSCDRADGSDHNQRWSGPHVSWLSQPLNQKHSTRLP